MFHQLIKNIEIGLMCFDLIILNGGFNSIETSLITFKMSDQGIEEGYIDARNLLDRACSVSAAWNSNTIRISGRNRWIPLTNCRSDYSMNGSVGFAFRDTTGLNTMLRRHNCTVAKTEWWRI